MKIAYLLPSSIGGHANGVRSQAVTWAQGLAEQGHHVDLINSWDDYEWKSYDLIHLFGYGTWLEMIPVLAQRTSSALVLSPIMDSNRAPWINQLALRFGGTPLNLTSPLYALGKSTNYLYAYYARSDHEKNYIQQSLGLDEKSIYTIPLSCRFSNLQSNKTPKENFCLHVSLLSSSNKNVPRLVDAAIKYGFRLVLAGKVGTQKFEDYLVKVISTHPNIEYAGFLSDDKLIELFSRAKVFALPSLFEGVGLVGLEAAALGADVVLTDRGAPKEYYAGMAYLVNPESVSDIGCAIVRALSENLHQPALAEYVRTKYSESALVNQLASSYKAVVDNLRNNQ